jgi:putative membrane protein
MMTADLAVLFQVGMAVALGVLIDTFLVRSILVPAITTLFGERAWWPSGSALARRSWPVIVTMPQPGRSGEAPRRRLALALGVAAVVPLLVTGLLAWSLNDPAGNLDGVSAAVVNLDAGATMTGPDGAAERVDLGTQIAERLTSDPGDATFTWSAASADDARAGLERGAYGVVLTVPVDFSSSIAAVVRGDAGAEPARLHLETDDAASYALGPTASSIVEAIAAETGREVTADAVDRILLSVDTARAGMDGAASDVGRLADASTDLADRAAGTSAVADGLVDGLGELADGMAAAGGGVGELATGVGRLASGSGQLADGVTSLTRGVRTAASGADALAGGAEDLADGLAEMRTQTEGFAAGVTELDAGAKQVDAGARQLAAGATALADTAATTAAMAGQLEDAVTGYAGTVESLAAGCGALGGGEPLCSQLQALAGGNAQLLQLAGGVSAYSDGVADGLSNPDPEVGLAAGAAALGQGTAGVAAGTGELAASAPELEQGIVSAATGADALAGAAGRLADGMDELEAGAKELVTAARTAAAGATRLADGTSAAADGALALVEGVDTAAEGARLVATDVSGIAGEGTAVADDAADVAAGLEDEAATLPTYPARLREALDSIVADPVAVASTRLNPAASEGTALAPLLTALGLWVGALAAYLVLPAFLGRVDPRRPWRRALAGFGAGALLGLVQAILVVLVLPLAVGIDVVRLPEIVLVAALAALAFVAINQALVALFDDRGWLVSLILLALQVAAAGTLYPAAASPELLQLLRPVLPMAFAVDELRALVVGGQTDLAPALMGLAAWLVGALVVTLAVAYRSVPASPDEAEMAAA